MRYPYILPSLIAILAICSSCSEDAKYNVNGEEAKTCTANEDCASGRCLKSGKCAPLREEGEVCNRSNPCKESLDCVDGICVKGQNGEPEDKTNACDPECEDGKVCWRSRCLTEDEIHKQNGCLSDDDCKGEKKNKSCLSDGFCGRYLEKGDDCMADERAVCPKNMSCIGVCIQDVSEGEKCSVDENIACANGLTCINDVCRKVDKYVQPGGNCNDEYLLCAGNVTCVNGTCIKVAKEEEACDESAFIRCEDGLQCLNSVCTPVGKSCASTKDCTEKDSFCCLEDSCGAKGKCIPYDEKTTHDETCRYSTKPGIFEAQVQCRWQYNNNPGDSSIISSVVGKIGNKLGLGTVIAVVSFGKSVKIQVIHPETCETLETIEGSFAGPGVNYLASADLDGDGLMEIVVNDANKHPMAYKWNQAKQKHDVMWTSNDGGAFMPMIFDVNGDTIPEVLSASKAFDGRTGQKISNNSEFGYGNSDTVFYAYGETFLFARKKLLKWNKQSSQWELMVELDPIAGYAAYADFGTPDKSNPSQFDYLNLDGNPELVLNGAGKLYLYSLIDNGGGKFGLQQVMQVGGYVNGGPITIGDFDSDGLPEIGVASKNLFGVYDPRCTGYEPGKCADKYVLWERWSQDVTSGQTGSSVFDFDGDGQAEAVYADECFTRVYEGKTGKVLFSARRSSLTWFEAPVIADVDDDGSTEIVIGSDEDMNCTTDGDQVDPIHEGIRCLVDEDCPSSKNCNKEIGFCTCTADAECNTQQIPGQNGIIQQYVCAEPIHPGVGYLVSQDNSMTRTMVKPLNTRPDGYSGNYKVCRATRKSKQIGSYDLMIFKDRLDRWVSSRNIWNQHAYNIINIEDNGKISTMEQWLANWAAKSTGVKIEGTSTPAPRYNSFRLNRQGDYDSGAVPDITGRFIAGSICGTTNDGRHVISAKLCNRGTKPVSKYLPATFYYYNEAQPDDRSRVICTSYTKTHVGVGECGQVGCEVSKETLAQLEGKKVMVVTNVNELGYASTVECNKDNNADIIEIEFCKSNDIVIIN